MLDTFLAVLFWFLAAFWLLSALGMLREVLWLHRLPPPESVPPGEPLPKVSIVIAARDEERRLEAVIRELLGQTGVEVEILIANDRSTDGSTALLDRLAASDPRIKPIHIQQLPEGWLGKCHACYQGGLQASGEWVLFTDADVRIGTTVIARALRLAREQQAQHVCMLFTPQQGSLLGWATQTAFYLVSFLSEANGINRDRTGAHVGIGAFNLVQTSAYRAIGGHEKLRLTVLDDVRLGLLMKRGGYRTRLAHGGHELTADWSATTLGFIRLTQKNLFGAANYSLARILSGTAVLWLSWALALAGFCTGTLPGVAAGLGVLSTIVPALMLTRFVGRPLLPMLLVPLVWPVVGLALVNSTWTTLRQGGVRWRDTFYPLEMLRRGNLQ